MAPCSICKGNYKISTKETTICWKQSIKIDRKCFSTGYVFLLLDPDSKPTSIIFKVSVCFITELVRNGFDANM